MASKSSFIISITRRLHARNLSEPFQPRLASHFAASIHTTPVPKWTICDNVLSRMVGAGNFRLESPASNIRNYARKPISKENDEEDEDSEDEDEDDLSFSDLDDEIDEDDSKVDESDEIESDEE